MSTTKEKAEIMLAFDRGEDIQREYCGRWIDEKEPNWNWTVNYRIKPKSKYRPLKDEELYEIRGKWIRYKLGDADLMFMVTEFCNKRPYFRDIGYLDGETLFEFWEYEDGSVIGKLE